MDNLVDPKLMRAVSTTQRRLGTYITKPVLSEKYLSKPPFRFLHEIFCNVIENTGFLKDTFSQDDLKYETFKSVEDKRAFLKKAIEAIESATGEKSEARPSKILAGKEADKTNGLLQLLSKGIKVDKERKELESRDNLEKAKQKDDKAQKRSAKDKTNNNNSTQKRENTKLQSRTRPINKENSNAKRTPSKPTLVSSESNEKRPGSSGIKSSPAKTSESRESNRTGSSREPLKHESNVKSSSLTSLVRKNPSTSNLLPKKSSSSKVIQSRDEKKSPKPAERTLSREGTASKSDREDGNESETRLPTPSREDIPLERPVTRTKYRTKNEEFDTPETSNDNEENNPEETNVTDDSKCPASPSKDDEDEANLNVETEDNEAKLTQDDEKSHEKPKSPEKRDDKQENEPEIEEVKQSKNRESSGTSSSSSSESEEVITEDMNLKISEWRANVMRNESEETLLNLNFKAHDKSEESAEAQDTHMQRSGKKLETSKSNERFQNNIKLKALPELEDVPTKLKRPITVLMDSVEDDEDDAFIVQEKMDGAKDANLERIRKSAMYLNMESLPMDYRGLLVKQIMETQLKLEPTHSSHNYHRQTSDMQSELAERDKEAMREVYLKQIETLKNSIQKMAKCANPLANITQRSQDDACLMEIEFRKLRQENDRLQRRIDDAKAETSKILFPLTEELSLVDSRIEKMEGAIILAKQRLHIMDHEYVSDFIEPVCETATGEEEFEDSVERNMLWDFAKLKEEDEEVSKVENKSLLKVFRKGLCIHDQEEDKAMADIASRKLKITRNNPSFDFNSHNQHVPLPNRPNLSGPQGSSYFPTSRSGSDITSSVVSPSVSNHGNFRNFYTQLTGIQAAPPESRERQTLQMPPFPRERPVDKEIRPPWWD